MIFSRKVFCGATKPRRPPGILTLLVAVDYAAAWQCGYEGVDDYCAHLTTNLFCQCRRHFGCENNTIVCK